MPGYGRGGWRLPGAGRGLPHRVRSARRSTCRPGSPRGSPSRGLPPLDTRAYRSCRDDRHGQRELGLSVSHRTRERARGPAVGRRRSERHWDFGSRCCFSQDETWFFVAVPAVAVPALSRSSWVTRSTGWSAKSEICSGRPAPFVGRPGLEPGTLGLKVLVRTSQSATEQCVTSQSRRSA